MRPAPVLVLCLSLGLAAQPTSAFAADDDKQEKIRRLLEICRDGFSSALSKPDILARLESEVPGFLLPDSPRPTRSGRGGHPGSWTQSTARSGATNQ